MKTAVDLTCCNVVLWQSFVDTGMNLELQKYSKCIYRLSKY